MSAELFSRLPYEVLPGVFLGNEFHAASLETLRVLDIVAVLNVGLPQCQDHFRDRGIRYLSCELFDNAESNFSSVFLHQAYPFITAACETKVKGFVVSRGKERLKKKKKKKKKRTRSLSIARVGFPRALRSWLLF
jgi:hypothetical protein